MLIEFNATNVLSIKEKQTLSMTAANAFKEDRQIHCVEDLPHTPPLLRSAVIYGPNASGKTNLLRALRFMGMFVTHSAKESQQGEEIGVKSFLFDSKTRGQPSEFEVSIIHEKVRYQYGFAVTQERVTDEWLFAFPEGRAQHWFSRQYDRDAKEYRWEMGKKLQGPKKLWRESVRDNALFLSTAVHLNSDQLQPLFQWFQDKLRIVSSGVIFSPSFTAQLCEENEEIRKQILRFLQAADLGIADISIKKHPFSNSDLPEDIPAEVRKEIHDKLDGTIMLHPKFLHRVSGRERMAALDLEDESTGSQNLFAMVGPLLDVIENERILLIDELNNHLHPMLARFFIKTFQKARQKGPKAQLVCTTHDATLLDTGLFRRDQIWFVEKNQDQSTRLYPLSDFTPRKREALGRGYLQGRYGALPYLEEWSY